MNEALKKLLESIFSKGPELISKEDRDILRARSWALTSEQRTLYGIEEPPAPVDPAQAMQPQAPEVTNQPPVTPEQPPVTPEVPSTPAPQVPEQPVQPVVTEQTQVPENTVASEQTVTTTQEQVSVEQTATETQANSGDPLDEYSEVTPTMDPDAAV